MTRTIRRQRHISARISADLRAALEDEAARQTGGDLSALVRHIAIDWLEARAVERISDNEIAKS
jgi:hypothetical protein